ncbi:hypothetical protein UFOVP347_6 [uncultured Caudovirales phage]|uniref:Uncharacterized protein n=1 Tax=uncultured Caudovirales phage TaxID=2100421 RepID=A0A6J5LYN1_9CAUD|nr:hypothetical protein UFOVP347_6 [uncultured Caudovirales phage]
MLLTATLFFAICLGPRPGDPPGTEETCEQGQIMARSCDAARTFLVAGLSPFHTIHILTCEEGT